LNTTVLDLQSGHTVLSQGFEPDHFRIQDRCFATVQLSQK